MLQHVDAPAPPKIYFITGTVRASLFPLSYMHQFPGLLEFRITLIILCKSIALVVIAVMHYKFFSQGKSALQLLFLMLRKFLQMHLYEYDTFAVHTDPPSPTSRNCRPTDSTRRRDRRRGKLGPTPG